MNIVVAVDQNWGIGYQGTQPLVIPGDRKHFREITEGGALIVGRKTLADFPGGKPLKNRYNVIMSTSANLVAENMCVVSSVDELFEKIAGFDPEKVFVIGGESVYLQLLDYCKYAYITKIQTGLAADRFFPNLDKAPGWSIVTEEPEKIYEGVKYCFVKYVNNNVKEF